MSDKKHTSAPGHTLSIADKKRVVPPASWKGYQKVLFRIAFGFFILMSIPLSGGWYRNLASIDWLNPHYRDIYDIARFSPSVRSFMGLSRGGGGDEGIAPEGARGERTPVRGEGVKDASERRKKVDGAQLKNESNLPDSGRGHRTKLSSPEDGVVSARDHSGNETQQVSASRLNPASSSEPVQKNRNSQPAVQTPPKRSFLADYADWGLALLIATIAGLIWTAFDRKRQEYNVLYYWLKVIVRYRAAIGIIGFGYTKLFPTQMPYPSLGLLNTDFGDFTAQKIYWLSVGIVPWYQVFGGVVELLAGGLLLFRKTTTYGAILLIGALGDITFVNYAYDGGVHVYAFYFVLLGAFLLVDDVPRLYNLLIRQQYTVPNSYYPYFTRNWLGYTRIGLKLLVFIIFFGILTYTEVINFKYDPYKQPSTAGVKQLRGNYAVTEFRLNDSIIPYSPVDSIRWQQATFENWTTLTFKVNKPVTIDPSNGGGSPMRDIQRTFEIAGTAGGQRAFHYYADTIENVLYLQDKNAVAAMRRGRGRETAGAATAKSDPRRYPESWISPAAWKNIGDENRMIDPRAYSTRRDREFARPARDIGRSKMILNYSTKDGSRVILKGLDENRDSIYVVLDRINKRYNLSESTLSAGKYN
ncbi:hypothetical protein [Daejeonella sp. JGW-45]|uniref:hypothetical protein n=1 Tax=Daejeonella sp. JGW-45 TaxID=3034148 RepID=UPI0023ED0F54|nr:hypothetical protein [Daejeonella sp. JGW-45]